MITTPKPEWLQWQGFISHLGYMSVTGWPWFSGVALCIFPILKIKSSVSQHFLIFFFLCSVYICALYIKSPSFFHPPRINVTPLELLPLLLRVKNLNWSNYLPPVVGEHSDGQTTEVLFGLGLCHVCSHATGQIKTQGSTLDGNGVPTYFFPLWGNGHYMTNYRGNRE